MLSNYLFFLARITNLKVLFFLNVLFKRMRIFLFLNILQWCYSARDTEIQRISDTFCKSISEDIFPISLALFLHFSFLSSCFLLLVIFQIHKCRFLGYVYILFNLVLDFRKENFKIFDFIEIKHKCILVVHHHPLKHIFCVTIENRNNYTYI